ncbi:MAG: rRNA maturation RNase YbeY [Chitinophagaceae bacterium]|nr:rRNA maturation RNase YbeY [Chitinophagaceae bacterium]
MTSKPKVCFFFEKKFSGLNNRTKLKTFIEYLFQREGRTLLNINYVFCSDKRLLEINRQYLNHDYYTDIITFDLSENESTEAEVYISIDRVKENAHQVGASILQELHRVMFHGALHLCGYSDRSMSEKSTMRAKEDKYLAKYFSGST